ncbi:YVTN family beta-propeller repeat protein [Larkinella rosea]|uniref:T9SS C-terminal target domain-containing protein n=1 Tax=Larkinella rosea TaxID=2025312 RepID=A0A3P1C3G5_9BACT|nr:beta-propeller fold lactonase family protein [Larkinella rosea]RRB07837.1 T9SS C-terminal target domain-containing protein [Larkinella rosea]
MYFIYSHFRTSLLVCSLLVLAYLPTLGAFSPVDRQGNAKRGYSPVASPCSATVTAPPNQTYCAGSITAPISFIGTGQFYSWTNSNPAIGLPASGTGTIGSFTALNATGSTQTAIITVIPRRQTFAYITSQAPSNVSVIDVTTNTIVTTIETGAFPNGVSVSLDGNRVYVSNSGSNTVSVIDAATNIVMATIEVGNAPFGVSVSPDGRNVYVSNSGSNTVSVIDATTNTVTATIGVGTSPNGVSVSPDGSHVYVANYGSSNLSVIDAATNTVTATIDVGSAPYGVSISPNGSHIYVANHFSDNVSVIDATTNTVIYTIPVGERPYGVSVSPDNTRVYVTNSGVDNVSVIDVATHTVTATIDVGSIPLGVSVSPDGSYVYVTSISSDVVNVIDATTNTVTATIETGSVPVSLGNFIGPASCEGTPQSFTLLVEPVPTAPSLNLTTVPAVTQPILINTPGVTLTATGCSGGVVSWHGPNGTHGSSSIIPVPTANSGGLVYSATCTLGSCASPPGSTTVTISPPLVSGSFDGFIYGADCSTFRGWAWDRNKVNTPVSIDILDGPNVIASFLADVFRQDLQTAGKGNGKHAFSWNIPDSFKDGVTHNLSARISGSGFILKDSPKALICQGSSTPDNKAPVPPSPTVLIAPLAAQVNVPFSGTLVAFTDPENQPLTYALSGLPDGLAINMTSRVISGTPTVAGTFVLAYSASDGVLTNSVSFPLTVNPASTTTVTGDFEGYLDKLDCGGIRGWVWDRKKPNTPLTVEFYRDGSGTVLGSTVANIYRQDLKDAGKGNGSHAYNFSPPGSVTSGALIRARVLGSTYELKGGAKAYQCAPARLSAETGSELRVTVLGNPVFDQVEVEIRGAEGQPLRLQLTDASGRLVGQRQLESAKAIERQHLSVQGKPAGLLLLRVTSGLKTVTVKVLKQ